MYDLTDKDFRSGLVARYLDAETDAREEMLLAEYFAEHGPDGDEVAVARLVLAEHPEALLAAGEREFAPRPAPRRRLLLWSCAATAAALALFLLLRPTAQPAPTFTPLEIAESLNMISNLGVGDIESATAVPSGANILVTVHLKDGTDLPFIMSKDGDTGTLSLASTR
jgi:hypothetical protein